MRDLDWSDYVADGDAAMVAYMDSIGPWHGPYTAEDQAAMQEYGVDEWAAPGAPERREVDMWEQRQRDEGEQR